MNSRYGMQRANGDWFALNQGDGFRVPIFSSSREAMLARSSNVEMLVFKPVLIDERSLKDLTPVMGQLPTHFWLVSDACVNLKRGLALNHSELMVLVRKETL